MKLKSNLHYIIFMAIFGTWIILLLSICQLFGLLSTSPPTFPRRIDPNVFTIFSIFSALSAISSFLMGLDKLGKLSTVKQHIRKRFNLD